MIIELAAQVFVGGWLSTHQIPVATGVDLVNAVMSEALGIEVSEKEPQHQKIEQLRLDIFFQKTERLYP